MKIRTRSRKSENKIEILPLPPELEAKFPTLLTLKMLKTKATDPDNPSYPATPKPINRWNITKFLPPNPNSMNILNPPLSTYLKLENNKTRKLLLKSKPKPIISWLKTDSQLKEWLEMEDTSDSFKLKTDSLSNLRIR